MAHPTSAEGPADRGLSVDWTACDGRGLCTDLLPELLEPDPWGFPRPRPGAASTAGPGALTLVPEGLAGPARQAVRLCPRLALRLTAPNLP
jgi:ferredoxin